MLRAQPRASWSERDGYHLLLNADLVRSDALGKGLQVGPRNLRQAAQCLP